MPVFVHLCMISSGFCATATDRHPQSLLCLLSGPLWNACLASVPQQHFQHAGPSLNPLGIFIYLSLTKPYKTDAVITILILQVRQLRHREVSDLPKVTGACKGLSQDSGVPVPVCCPTTMLLHSGFQTTPSTCQQGLKSVWWAVTNVLKKTEETDNISTHHPQRHPRYYPVKLLFQQHDPYVCPGRGYKINSYSGWRSKNRLQVSGPRDIVK